MLPHEENRYALPYDICRCTAKAALCPYKDDCARYTSNYNPCAWQPQVDASVFLIDNTRCGMFIDNRTPFDRGD